MQHVVRIATVTRWLDDNGNRRNNETFQFIGAFDKRDAIHIARSFPPYNSSYHGQDISRRADVVLAVYDAKGKRIYLDETTLDMIGSQITEPDMEAQAAE